MHSNYIKKIFGFKDVLIRNINSKEDSLEFTMELPVTEQICPCCGAKTKYIKDYYKQQVRDIPFNFKPTTIFFKKPRYVCNECGKTFYPQNEVVRKYKRTTTRLTEYVINELRKMVSISTISKNVNVSPNFISRTLPYLSITNTKLPEVLCIDEFKGNSGNNKYQVILLDGITHEIIDILDSRYKHSLCDYFKRFPQEELNNVKYLVTDLWKTYKDIGMTYFRKAKIVADRFHWSRYATEAMDKIRKETQSKLTTTEKRKFKKSRKLLLSRKKNLRPESLERLDFLLFNFSENLRIAYREKEEILDIIHSTESPEIKKLQFSEWVKRNLESNISQLQECAKTFFHWSYEIKNSLEVPFSNGPTEGKNNKIKTLKRITFGMPNFKNFKARILLSN